MSLAEVTEALRELPIEDESLQCLGMARVSAEKMMAKALKADKQEPHAIIEYVVWPDSSSLPNSHYALMASENGISVIFNPVKAPGFPRYSGDAKDAPGRLARMKPSQAVL